MRSVPSGAEALGAASPTFRSSPQWLSDATGAERFLKVSYTPAGRVIVDGLCSFLADPGHHEHDSAAAWMAQSSRTARCRREGAAFSGSARLFGGMTSQ